MGGENGAGDLKVTLALKPVIVFPPGGLTNQAAQSERDRASQRGGDGKEGMGAMVAMVTSREMCAHLFICGLWERAWRPLRLSRCVQVLCVCQRVAVDASKRTRADSPGVLH